MIQQKFLLLFLFAFSVSNVTFAAPNAESQHELVQRLVLFPLSVPKEQQELADNIWWDIRSQLTESKRFLIASKNFMQSKDVFQARSKLKAADAILLGRLLDAHALLTLSLDKFTLTLRSYDGRKGVLLSEESIELHPSVPASKQLADASQRLTMDFLSKIPYQAYVYTDEIVGQPIFKEGEQWSVNIFLGANHQVSAGDPVQIIQLNSKSLDPVFQEGGNTVVVAEGRVKSVDNEKAQVVLDRVPFPSQIVEASLVRLPKEEQRLQETFKIVKSSGPTLELDALGQSTRMTDDEKEKKPLVTAVAFITNLVIMFLAVL